MVEARESAERSAAAFAEVHQSSYLAPEVSVHRDVGSDDRPLFIFRLNVDLADDLASSEYPMDELQDLASELRSNLAGTEVDRFRWLVMLGTKAAAARR